MDACTLAREAKSKCTVCWNNCDGKETELIKLWDGRLGTYYSSKRLSPSMRRPVDVKAHFHLLLFVNQFPFSQAASVAILLSALFFERYSFGARWVFSSQ